MSEQIDAGAIVSVTEVSNGQGQRSYAEYLRKACRLEAAEIQRVLAEIERTGEVRGRANVALPGLKHKRNPTREELRAIRRTGLRV